MAPPSSGPPRQPRPLPLLLLLLHLGGPPVLANEGGAAGSCKCLRRNFLPEKVDSSFADKVMSWHTCQPFVRFIFPKMSICGLPSEPWVEKLKKLIQAKSSGASRADASKGGPELSPASRISPPPQTSTGPPAGATTSEPHRVQPDPDFTTAATWAPGLGQEETPPTQLASDILFTPGAAVDLPRMAGDPPRPSQGAAGAGPSKVAPQASPVQHTTIAVTSLLGTTLLLVAIIVFLLCRKKRQPCRRPLATPIPPGGSSEETLTLRHREET